MRTCRGTLKRCTFWKEEEKTTRKSQKSNKSEEQAEKLEKGRSKIPKLKTARSKRRRDRQGKETERRMGNMRGKEEAAASSRGRGYVRYNTRNTCNTDNTRNTCVTPYTPSHEPPRAASGPSDDRRRPCQRILTFAGRGASEKERESRPRLEFVWRTLRFVACPFADYCDRVDKWKIQCSLPLLF